MTTGDLQRGAQLKLLGEINELDHDYYWIEFTTATGETATGYVPKSYASLTNAIPGTPTQTVVGDTVGDNDKALRFVYLILGFAIVCILTDFLILRKKDEDDE